jgi:hypothetical protein
MYAYMYAYIFSKLVAYIHMRTYTHQVHAHMAKRELCKKVAVENDEYDTYMHICTMVVCVFTYTQIACTHTHTHEHTYIRWVHAWPSLSCARKSL